MKKKPTVLGGILQCSNWSSTRHWPLFEHGDGAPRGFCPLTSIGKGIQMLFIIFIGIKTVGDPNCNSLITFGILGVKFLSPSFCLSSFFLIETLKETGITAKEALSNIF